MFHRDQRRGRRVFHLDKRRGVASLFSGLGNKNTEVLSDPVDFIVLQRNARLSRAALFCQRVGIGFKSRRILARQNVDYAGRGFRRGNIH